MRTIKKSVGGARNEIECARTEGTQRDPRLSGEPSVGRCHESCRLLMTSYDQFDGGSPKAFDDIEVLLAGYTEDTINTLVLQGRNEKI
jgi:hypothetical protein